MLYKNTVFYNQMSPFPAIIFVSNMYIKSVTVHYVNPVASSLVCTDVAPLWRLSAANWKCFSLLLLCGPSNVIHLFGRVRQKQRCIGTEMQISIASLERPTQGTRNLVVPGMPNY